MTESEAPKYSARVFAGAANWCKFLRIGRRSDTRSMRITALAICRQRRCALSSTLWSPAFRRLRTRNLAARLGKSCRASVEGFSRTSPNDRMEISIWSPLSPEWTGTVQSRLSLPSSGRGVRLRFLWWDFFRQKQSRIKNVFLCWCPGEASHCTFNPLV